jgi:serine/threonine protein kinase
MKRIAGLRLLSSCWSQIESSGFQPSRKFRFSESVVDPDGILMLPEADGIGQRRDATVIGLHLCAAVDGVHASGLLHRDIKANNVMREDSGRVVLMDFGLCQEIRMASLPEPDRENLWHSRLYGAGTSLGRESYASERHLQHRSLAVSPGHQKVSGERPESG